MSTPSARRNRRRQRGSIQELPSGALRVSMYAGTDPLTGRRHYLRETIPAGPSAQAEADKAMRRLATEVDERRNPRTSATVNQLLDRHFELAELEENTLTNYRNLAAKHIRPLIGTMKVGALDGYLFDTFYATLRRCRDHCDRRQRIDHCTDGPHQCDERCKPHQCRPLSNGSIRYIHFVLSGALKRAVRWRWIATNPIAQADPPPQPKPNPQPPTVEQAARILNEAWQDPDWAMLVWLTMVTGFRRGELCAIRWRHFDLEAGVLTVERSIGQRSGRTWEKDTKTHQHRRIALDTETLSLLSEHRDRCEERAAALGLTLIDDAFVFSLAVDGSVHLKPDSVSQRYARLARRLGISTTIHKLRHYSATELISAGVDVRTVAGRLGHGGGGTTTLKVYAAWVSESDQRAAISLFSRLPARPDAQTPGGGANDGDALYPRIAAELRAQIVSGELPIGAQLPTHKQLAEQHGISVSTAHRVTALLHSEGLVEVSRGRRATVVRHSLVNADQAPHPADGASTKRDDTPIDDRRQKGDREQGATVSAQLWAITVRGPDGCRYPVRHVCEDINRPDSFRAHLLAIARMERPTEADRGESWIGDYELEVREPGKEREEPKFTLRWQPQLANGG
ncbi:MAG: tyrosine-type recombinase/integrase [Pseudonocardiales bacterium]|nr:tyrosine-type recombinase/integrase [Pseudonocardiales bacterium]